MIQTIGRAARNLNGKAILYADKITRSMELAMNETSRRREKQVNFNLEHNITPRSINKAVKEMIDGVMSNAAETAYEQSQEFVHELTDEKALAKTLKQLEKQMLDHAKNLEFEQAAAVRDKLNRLKNQLLLQ